MGLTLAWTAPNSTGGAPLSFYNVTCTMDAVSDATKASYPPSVTATATRTAKANAAAVSYTFDDGSKPRAGPFRCSVTASNGAKLSAPSLTAQIEVHSSPSAPSFNGTGAGGSFSSLTWSPPTSDGGLPITNYTVACSTTASPTKTATMVFSPAPQPSTPLVTMLFPSTWLNVSTSYRCQVSANNALAGGAPSERSAPFVRADLPAAPANLTLAGLTLKWTPPFNGGMPILDYNLTCLSEDKAVPALQRFVLGGPSMSVPNANTATQTTVQNFTLPVGDKAPGGGLKASAKYSCSLSAVTAVALAAGAGAPPAATTPTFMCATAPAACISCIGAARPRCSDAA